MRGNNIKDLFSAYDTIPIASTMWDQDLNLINCNDALVKLLGLSSKEECIARFHEMSPKHLPDGAETAKQSPIVITETFEKGSSHFYWSHVNISGEIIPVEVHGTCVTVDDKVHGIFYAIDLRPVTLEMEKVKEAERTIQSILDTAPVAVCLYDRDLFAFDCNQESLDLFGTKDKASYLNMMKFLMPPYQPDGEDSLKMLNDTIEETFNCGKSKKQFVCTKTDGTLIYVEGTYARMDYKDTFIVVEYLQDLTDIQATMTREREANELIRLYMDNSPNCIEFWDEDGTLIDCNTQTWKILDLSSKEEFITRYDDLSPKYQPCGTLSTVKSKMMVDKAFKEGHVRFEWLHRKLSGELVPMEAAFVRIKYQGKNIITGYCHDLREVKGAMVKLREADKRAKVLLDSTPISCYLLNSNLQAIDCNRAALELFARNPEGPAPGDPCNWDCEHCRLPTHDTCVGREHLIRQFMHVFPDYMPESGDVADTLRECCAWAEKFGEFRFEYPQQTLYGEEFLCEITIVPVQYESGQGFAYYVRDLRDTQILREEMKRRELAEEESWAKTRFLARMSHEIRTPMNAVLGITEIMLQRSDLARDIEEAFVRIFNSSSLLLTIINDILDLSKIEAGKMEIILGVYEMESLIVDIVQLNLMQVDSKVIDFKLNIDPCLPAFLLGDELRIKQILNNLLSNAFKYTDAGWVSLSFYVEEVPESDQVVLVFEVSDTGSGMAQEQIDHIFDVEFVRFNRTIEGTGLGLNITNQLVNMMDGTIEATSVVGQGTTFTVRIPQIRNNSRELGEEVSNNLQNLEISQKAIKKMKLKRAPMPHGKVLVVDDVESNLFVAKGLLMPYKLAVETVESGIEAIERIRSGETYDIIFMDHMMPDMDGITATKILRDAGYDRPIVALTANTVKGQSQLFMDSGFSGFISKPIDINRFDACLRRFIPTAEIPPLEELLAESGIDLIDSFLRDVQKALDILEPMSEGELDLKRFTTYVHAIKSALLNIGEDKLSEEAYKLELAGRDGDADHIKAKLPGLVEELKYIQAQYTPKEGPDVPDSDPALLAEQLSIIAVSCQNYDIEAADTAIDTLRGKAWSKNTKRTLDEIAAHLLHSDFEEAAECAHALMRS